MSKMEPNSMFTVTYVSAARQPFKESELVALLQRSRDNNQLHDITGMLLYKDSAFIQAIEGPKEAVQQLYANIRRDPTHHRIITLIEEDIAERAFPDWSMGFHNLSGNHAPLPGYTDFMKKDRIEGTFIEPSDAKVLLYNFRGY